MARRRRLTTDRRLIAAFLTIGVAGTALAGWQVAHAEPPASSYDAMVVPPREAGRITLAFGGDTMFDDGARALMSAHGIRATLTGVQGLLADADLAFVNAEAPITSVAEQLNPGAKYQYASPPEAADALAELGVDVLQLGNNHSMDRTVAGLTETMTRAEQTGLRTLGAGTDIDQAMRPLIAEIGDQKIAFVSLGENFGRSKRADVGLPGTVALTPDVVMRGMRIAQRAGADRVVALLHWGDNYGEVNEQQRYWAGQLVEAGYDAVIGTGSHTLQAVEMIDGVPVVYGIGNFVFGSPGRFAGNGAVGLGAVATLTFEADGSGALSLRCLRTDNAVVQYVARVCDAEETGWAAGIVGAGMQWTGAEGTLRF